MPGMGMRMGMGASKWLRHFARIRIRFPHTSITLRVMRPLDLHALSTPPAFTLSQDQTLTIDRNLLKLRASTFALAYWRTQNGCPRTEQKRTFSFVHLCLGSRLWDAGSRTLFCASPKYVIVKKQCASIGAFATPFLKHGHATCVYLWQ